MNYKFIGPFTVFWCFLGLFFSSAAWANPYFYITGSTEATTGEVASYYVRLNTDGNQIGALQTAISYDLTYFNTTSISVNSSVCSLWSPANSVPPGENFNKVTPYFYSSKAVLTCGFTGSGYNGSDGLVATIKLTPHSPGSTSLSFSDSIFQFLGSSITPGAMSNFNITITGTPVNTQTPTPNPSVTPTVTPTATATPSPTSSTSATPTPIITTTTLFDDIEIDDITSNVQDLNSRSSANGSSGNTNQASGDLEIVDQDDAIPAPPANLTPRPKATPFTIPEYVYDESNPEEGDVLSVADLRDLLVPGRSKADRTVVLINFVSVLVFLLLLALLFWRMLLGARANRLKTRHIQELIEGELAALETKMQILKEKSGTEKFKEDFSEAVDNILDEVNRQNRQNKKQKK